MLAAIPFYKNTFCERYDHMKVQGHVFSLFSKLLEWKDVT